MNTANKSQKGRNSGVQWLEHWMRCCVEAFFPIMRLLVNLRTVAQIPRLLKEGREPVRRMIVQAHNSRELKRLIAQGEQITFVTSFARSGNTWMRYLLSDVLLQKGGVQTSTELDIHPDRIIADYYGNLLTDRDPNVQTPGVVVKTHDDTELLARRIWGHGSHPLAAKLRHLYLFRAPEDSLVSFYHLHLRENYIKGAADIDTFCREALRGWINHVSSYLNAAERGAPVFFVAYEQMLADPEGTLSEVLQWLGVPHTRKMVETAACNMQFQKLKTMEDRRGGGKRPTSLRVGRSGAGRTELNPETIELIRAETSSLVKRLAQRAEQSRLVAREIRASRLASESCAA